MHFPGPSGAGFVTTALKLVRHERFGRYPRLLRGDLQKNDRVSEALKGQA
jgi:hypothetical protein